MFENDELSDTRGELEQLRAANRELVDTNWELSEQVGELNKKIREAKIFQDELRAKNFKFDKIAETNRAKVEVLTRENEDLQEKMKELKIACEQLKTDLASSNDALKGQFKDSSPEWLKTLEALRKERDVANVQREKVLERQRELINMIATKNREYEELDIRNDRNEKMAKELSFSVSKFKESVMSQLGPKETERLFHEAQDAAYRKFYRPRQPPKTPFGV